MTGSHIHRTEFSELIDDTAKEGLTIFWFGDSLRAETFETLIKSLFEDIWASN